MSDAPLLVTGADGYVGRRVVRHYVEHSDRPVTAWVRAEDENEFEHKRATLAASLRESDAGDGGARVTWAWGDLVDAEPFRRVDRATVADVVHSAAVTRFTVDAETARRVNTEGAEKLLRFASECPSLHAIGMLSTLYASGLQAGPQDEAPCGDEAGFANHYEHSKWRAEQAALGAFGDLPIRVLRLATVIADDDNGSVGQYNAVHNTLKLFFYGLLSLLPGTPDTPLYFITGDFAARAVAAVLDDDDARGVFHVAHDRGESLTLERLVDLAFEEFGRAPEFSGKRILPPLYTDSESFELLVGGLSSFGGNVVNQALASVAPFARQLFVHKEIRNDRLRSVMADYTSPDSEAVIARTCEHLVATRWGRAHAA